MHEKVHHPLFSPCLAWIQLSAFVFNLTQATSLRRTPSGKSLSAPVTRICECSSVLVFYQDWESWDATQDVEVTNMGHLPARRVGNTLLKILFRGIFSPLFSFSEQMDRNMNFLL